MPAQSANKPNKDWREKYYEILDQLDDQERVFLASEKKLVNSIVKLCISHQGSNPQLDEEINLLRNKIRNTSNRNQRDELIQDSINKIISASEKQQQPDDTEQDNSLAMFLDQLSMNTEDKHGINRLKQKLAENSESDSISKIIRQTSTYFNNILQKNTPTDITTDSKQSESSGFATTQTTSANPVNELTEINQKLLSISNTQERLKTIENIISLLNNSVNDSIELATESKEAYELFIQLLEWLTTPENFKQEYIQLKNEFTENFFNQDPKQAIKTISDFIGQINRSLQFELAEMETYLAKVINRLKEFEDHLVGSKTQQQETLFQAQNLTTQMKKSTEQLKNEIDSCCNIDEIKTTLDSHLEIIDANLDIHLKSEQERQQESQKAIESLAKRVVQIEKESHRLQDLVVQERQKALKDALTGIANRLAYEDKILEEFTRWQRYKQNLSIGIVDIDDFKHINDQYGHTAGDRVLKTVAKLCDEKIRSIDFIARYGGEEFVLVFPNTGLEKSLVAAEHLRATINDCEFQYNKEKVPITVSIGIAEFTQEDDIEAVFNRADRALYKAKNSGKNRCITAKDCS